MRKARKATIKRAIVLPAELNAELAREGRRLERSASWLLAQAWVRARESIREIPTPPESMPTRRRMRVKR